MLQLVRSSDGVKIAIERSGAGSPVLLIHGTTSDRARWAPVMKAFEAQHSVYAMDRRGRGDSGDNEPYRMAQEFDDVGAAIDAIGGKIDVVAHSYGAICALEAATRTQNIRKLVLYEPPITVPGVTEAEAPQLEIMRQHLATDDRKAVLETFYLQVLRVSPEEWESVQKMPNWRARLQAAHTIPREFSSTRGYVFEAERFRGVAVPTLLMLGGESLPRHQAAIALLNQTLSQSQVCVLAGQQHNAINTAPRLFESEALRFLAG